MPLRPIRRSDHEGLNRLHRAVGWPERSPAGWRWLEDNPARQDLDAPMGWVVADEQDRPAAMLGNFVQRFRLGSRRLHAATGFSIIVPPERKGASRGLIRALMAQPRLFARYTFNANPRSAPLYKLFGLSPWPDKTHHLKLSWIVDPMACAQGRALRHLLGRISAETAARLGERLMNRRLFHPEPMRLPADITPLRDFSDSSPYDAFWRALTQEDRLLADRSPEVLRWRLADPDLTIPPLLLACVQGGRIVGVAQALMTKTSLIEPPCLDILDLVALKDAPDAVARLTRGLIDNARSLGAAKVRLQTVTPDLLDALGELGVQARREGGWGHCHALIDDPALAAAWAPTPFDGDYGVCARTPPLPRVLRARLRAATPAGQVSKA
ncbi:N-acetyltransferase [Brevundimonas sp. SORGH_AS_0993]|uniref:N-acetyltransferase n=1 Tax=Brevundimonas sp. SORGH_AS_0993 TaxID=3041794 RepID=UPI0027D88ED2|nr:N-acetyltransferase [Brevundimonas sp. SORGH_AS_0993]